MKILCKEVRSNPETFAPELLLTISIPLLLEESNKEEQLRNFSEKLASLLEKQLTEH